MNDIIIIFQKEFKELFTLTKPQSVIFRILIFVCLVGVIFPLKLGVAWFVSPITLYYWCWLSAILIVGPSANSIIRERRLGTLEALLASRLSDKGIYIGKFIAGMLYTYIIIVLSVFVGWITINISEWGNGLLFYSPSLIIGGLLICLFLMCVIGGICFLLSMKTRDSLKVIQIINLLIFALIIPGLVIYWFPKNTIVDSFVKVELMPLTVLLLLIIFFIFSCVIFHFIKKNFSRPNLIE